MVVLRDFIDYSNIEIQCPGFLFTTAIEWEMTKTILFHHYRRNLN